MRLHLEANDRFLVQLQSSLDQLTKPVGTLASDSSITQQLDSLALSQSNTLALLQKLTARTTSSQPAVNGAERTAAALTVLQASLNDQQEKLEVARHRASDLLLSLNVPPEIATESRREREILQAQTDRLRLRIIQERVDGGSLDDLQSSVADYRQKFEAARHTVADLVLTLNVPPGFLHLSHQRDYTPPTSRPTGRSSKPNASASTCNKSASASKCG